MTSDFLPTEEKVVLKTKDLHPFTTSVMEWFYIHGRDLPWRGMTDPYAIWLSEVILQQTRISQGWDYWERFIRRWPNVQQLARATEDEVLREWQGLGYYSRARNLLVAAKQVVQLGGFPNSFEELRKLKGVGDYTAAAIASFAFHQPVAVVDGNVFRVLSRHFGINTPINTTKGKKEFAALARLLLPADKSAVFNQAMMDFGAMQCVPVAPACHQCPIRDTCEACLNNQVECLPVKIKKLKVRERQFTYFYIRCRGETAIHRRGKDDIWRGLWEPFLQEGEGMPSFIDDNGKLTLLCHDVKHVLTHQILRADFFLYETDNRPNLPESFVWIPEEDINQYAIPRLVERLLLSLQAK